VVALDLEPRVAAVGTSSHGEAEGNLACKYAEHCRWTYVAKRDIRKGESLVLEIVHDEVDSRWDLVSL
jgi:hypothetical protein